MKVLHVITRLDPGGSSRIVKIVHKELQKRGHDVCLAAGGSFGIEGNIIKIKHLKRDINLFYDILAIFEIFFLIKKLKPELLHLHSSKAGFCGRIAGRMAGIKRIIYQPHGIVFYGYFNKFKSNILLYVERILAGFCEKIVALSNTSRNEFIEYKVADRDRITVIENGIDIATYGDLPADKTANVEQRKILGIPEEAVVFGMVGRIVKLKGHEYFLKALKKAIDERKDVYGLIVGDGEELRKINVLIASLGIKNWVKFTGYKEDIRKMVSVIDVLVQPSLVEGFGMVVIEAGAMNVPTVGFRTGGLKDIIIDNKTGILVDYKDIDSLSEAMLRLYDQPSLREELGRNAKDRVLSIYSINKMIDKIEELYKSL